MPGHFVWVFAERSNLTYPNCTDGVQWIWETLHDCVTDEKGIASTVLGLVSLVIWMLVGFPQMIKNCRNIRGIEGISIFLLVQWMLGDSTNLIGCILTDQLPLQTYLGIYFVAADIVLLIQYIYYQIWLRNQEKGLISVTQNGPSQVVLCFAGAFLAVNGFGALLKSILPVQDVGFIPIMHHPSGRSLMAANLGQWHLFHRFTDEAGYAVGIISSLFYIGSRSCQLWKNFKRKSTEGLSILMFWLAILGNLTYGLAILVRSVSPDYVILHLPWLVGSLGVIFLDVSLVIQFKYYGQRDFNTLARAPLTDNEILPSSAGSMNSID